MRIRFALLAITVAAALVPDRVQASPIVFTDRTEFNAFAQTNLLITFDSLTYRDWSTTFEFPPGSGNFPIGQSYCFPAIDCTVLVDGALRVWNPGDQFPPSPTGGELRIPGLPISDAFLGLEDGSRIGSIGFDVSPTSEAVLTVTYGDFGPPFGPPPGVVSGQVTFLAPSFVGLLFSSPVDNVRIGVLPLSGNVVQGPLQSAIVDNIAITSVPEPSTLLLFGSGIAVVQFRRWRQRINSR